jgi:hypothetical protein
MAYTIPPQNAVDASWEDFSAYTYQPFTNLNGTFVPELSGTITGLAEPGTTIIAFPRTITGLNCNIRYETITNGSGAYTLAVSQPGKEFLVICMSPSLDKNSLCKDWIVST